jgi:glucose-6-phosphate dehydrogenase assembly protein OpcA
VAGDLTVSEGIWSARDTTPSEVEAALGGLLRQRHAESEDYVPARVLNLVVVADRQWRGEIQNRLDRVGRYHASRTILCTVEPGRETIDARVTASAEDDLGSGAPAVGRESVLLEVGPRHLARLDGLVDSIVVTDLATLVWSPHGHPDALDALLRLAQIVLLDSGSEPDPAAATSRALELAKRAYLVDLAWLRSTPWRERVASTFDPDQWRSELHEIGSVEVRHQPESVLSALLFLGWLCRRLGWEPGSLVSGGSAMEGIARGARRDVALRLEPDATMPAPGLAGVTVESASGMRLSLDRGPGGLTARRRDRGGRESTWTVMGASRGEPGILGEGIRQALLRDRGYGPALSATAAMLA